MIKAVCFALDDIIFQKGRANFILNLTKNGAEEFEAERIFVKSDLMNKIYKLGKISDNEYWKWALKGMKVHLTPTEAIELLVSGYELNESLMEYVKKIRAAGFKVMICSNSFQARIEGLQQKFHFLENFDDAVFSFIRGVDKPNKEIYEVILKRSQVAADEIVYVDDNDLNLAGAEDFGFKTIKYTTFEQLEIDLKKLKVEVS